MKISIKVYIDKYDTQGTPLEIDTDTIVTREDWENVKQKAISDFIEQFNIGNIKVKGHKVSDLLKEGFYKDNKMNREKKRVGLTYTGKGTKLVETVKDAIRNRNFQVEGESKVLQYIEQPIFDIEPSMQFKRRQWLDKEVEMLKDLKNKGITYKAIGLRLFRRESSVGSKWRRIK